jgi:hypothetical protein
MSIPGDLLRAISERSGRVTFVLGAGCSLEEPTSLSLSSVYSKAIFDRLVADGELLETECADPWDLSCVASAVFDKFGEQRKVVERLPRNDFRYARANDGYLIAAALLAEGAVSCVATLNYDLALTDAVRQLDARATNEIAGPSHLADFGASSIVYLHRNVNEQDTEKWILRREALDHEWQTGWESVVAARVASAPVIVFAGLGSPAAVLTESVARIRALVPDALVAYLVDPSESSSFAEALSLEEPNHIRARWSEFMGQLAQRLALEARVEARRACDSLIAANGWSDAPEKVDSVCAAYEAAGLLRMGRNRAGWLTVDRAYEPDHPAQRELVADLLLGVALLCGQGPTEVVLQPDGAFVLSGPTHPPRRVLAVSGRGTRRWSQLDPLLATRVGDPLAAADLVLAAGFQGTRPPEWAPPDDIVAVEPRNDITVGVPSPRVVAIDDLRRDPDLLDEVAC